MRTAAASDVKVKYPLLRLWVAVIFIWLCSGLAVLFVYYQNKNKLAEIFLQHQDKEEYLQTNTAIVLPAPLEAQRKEVEKSYVMIQYNKKLMFTRYNNLENSLEAGKEYPAVANSSKKPFVIKRTRIETQPAQKNDFDVRPVPQ